MQSTIEDIRTRFLDLEDEFDVFNIRPENFPIWERLRFNIFRKIYQSQEEDSHVTNEFRFSDYFDGLRLWIKNLFVKNPFLADDHEFIFDGHPRRKMLDDEMWWDIYCDPLYEQENIDYVHIEKPYQMGHKTPAKTNNLRYHDFILYTGAIRRNFGTVDVQISGKERRQLESLSDAIEERFNVDINIVRKGEIELTERASVVDLYMKLFKKIKPSVVVGVPDLNVQEACQNLDITTVEIQHGVVHQGHLKYHYPGKKTEYSLADYFFTWGEYWSDQAAFPIPDERIIPVGFPYLDQQHSKYDKIRTKNQILFISQDYIGEQLSKFACRVQNHPAISHDIIYKLHPKEYNDWESNYPWLRDADFNVIDESGSPLYQLFAESAAQVGVSSTALFEGLIFNLDTYIYDSVGYSIGQELVESESICLISSVDEFAASLEEEQNGINQNLYFETNATHKMYDELKKVARE